MSKRTQQNSEPSKPTTKKIKTKLSNPHTETGQIFVVGNGGAGQLG